MTGREWGRYLAVVLVAGPLALGLAMLAGWVLSPLPVPSLVRFTVAVTIVGAVAKRATALLPAAELRRDATAEAYLIGAVLLCEAVVLFYVLDV